MNKQHNSDPVKVVSMSDCMASLNDKALALLS